VVGNDEVKARRQRRSVEEKRRLVALTRAPDATVARVARDNGVNANQLHGWRRLEDQGKLGAAAAAGTLLAVRVKAGEAMERRGRPAAGGLWLELRRGSVRVENGADPALLRLVLEQLVG